MYNIKLDSYVPEPQPASTDRIVAAHYYAAWKYGAAQIHNGFNDLATQFPQNTPLMGYYDEENPEVCDWEIKWAVEHGINCFIYCWYRNKSNTGKPITLADLRCGHGLHEALFNAKYQQHMKFAIMYEASVRWGGTDSEDIVKNLMPFWMENYFKRGNYLVIDNKPVLFVYSQNRLANECFKNASEQRAAFDACREYARKEGFDGMTFAVENRNVSEKLDADYLSRGYDFIFGYSSGYAPKINYPDEAEIIEAQRSLFEQRLAIDPMCHIPTATCFRDATPRCSQHWIDMGYSFHKDTVWYLTPEGYRTLIYKMKKMSDALPDGAWAKKLFMIDNWNEWDEGHYVSPSHSFGFKFLQAIREELTACDNLPDYRMPQDMGFSGYNKSWVTPDFSQFCEKLLKKKNF